MATLTGLFQRGTAFYMKVVLPQDHPSLPKYKNGRVVVSLGACSQRDAIAAGTVKRAQILAGLPHKRQPKAARQPDAVAPPPVYDKLRDIFERWQLGKPRSEDAVRACLRAVMLFEQYTGNAPIRQVTRQQGEGFRSWLQHPDRNTTSKTARDRLVWVKAVLTYASRDLGVLDRNPWDGLDIAFKTTNKRRPWTTGELTTFFSQPIHMAYCLPKNKKAGADAAYWIPLLGLYTGARVGELAQMRLSDISDCAGVPVFNITDEGDGQSVKTEASTRQVPIHSELLRLGFLDYVDAQRLHDAVSLWPNLVVRDSKPGGYFSQWFGTYRRSLGFGTNPNFHCLRHTVRSQLAEAKVSEQIIDTIVGHEVAGSTGARVYTHRSITTLKRAIEVLNYPILSLPKVYRALLYR
jgi:integrase